MTEEEYRELYNRIKGDLYDEFINPETANYGADVLRQKEVKERFLTEDIYSNILSENEIIREEIRQLKVVMQRYEDDEEYEHAAFMKKRIENLKKRL
jgi:protein-arginine kinase activator protein McsA